MRSDNVQTARYTASYVFIYSYVILFEFSLNKYVISHHVISHHQNENEEVNENRIVLI